MSGSLKKQNRSMGNITRNAHSKTVEKLDMKVGQWIFLSKAKNTISEKYTHYVHILKHVQIIKFRATNTNDMSLESWLKV